MSHSVPWLVDSHQHYWDPSLFPYDWPGRGLPAFDRPYLPDDLASAAAEVGGLAGSITVQVLHDAGETRWMLGLGRATPTTIGVVGWVDLREDPDPLERSLVELRRDPLLVGIRHLVHDEPDDWLTRPDVLRGLAVLERLGIPYDLLLRPQHLRLVPMLADQMPDLRMVIDHLAKPSIAAGTIEPWASELRAAAEAPNVWCKLSGMVTEADHATWRAADLAPYVEVAVAAFGPDRLMFGSDWPVCTLAASYAAVVGSLREVLGPVDTQVEQRIFAGSARSFYGLPG